MGSQVGKRKGNLSVLGGDVSNTSPKLFHSLLQNLDSFDEKTRSTKGTKSEKNSISLSSGLDISEILPFNEDQSINLESVLQS